MRARFNLLLSICAAFLFVLIPVPAKAATIDNWSYECGVPNTEYTYTALSNVITLTIDVSSDTEKVLVNGEERGYWDDGEYAADVPLDPGENEIKIEAVDELSTGDNDTKSILINYLQDNIAGSRYIIKDLSKAAVQQEIFGGGLKLELPEQHAVMSGETLARNQKVEFKVNRPNVQPLPGEVFVSNIFTFQCASSNYNISPETKITLKYNSQISDTEHGRLTIMRALPVLTPQLGFVSGAENLGGAVNTVNNTITAVLTGNPFGHYVVVKKNGDFKDFYKQGYVHSPVAWSRPCVLTLWAKGVMSPIEHYTGGADVPENYFGLVKPGTNKEVPVTRKELACMLVKGLHIKKDVQAVLHLTYTDINGLSMMEKINIETASRSGFFSGQPGEKGMEFNPAAKVTREQAAVIFVRAANLPLPDSRQAEKALQQHFKEDFNEIERWKCPYIMSALQHGLIDVENSGEFCPGAPLTRAKAAETVYQLVKSREYL
ncbi:MAG: S-layer homology domain-containing protein [Clostridiales bacterium]|nr:S-layer homology domain-containing protein [Clostridiales bacterium]MCF8022910.1 S-layer homology domain-containing protein [Clostridiales bacterium]